MYGYQAINKLETPIASLDGIPSHIFKNRKILFVKKLWCNDLESEIHNPCLETFDII